MNECLLTYFICLQWRAYAISLGKTPPDVRMGNWNQLLRTWLEILKSINA